MSVSAEVDERTLNEIYLPAFEACVKKGHAWSVMSSYNRINGVYAAESRLYLREKWGFEGCVISDWCGVNARVADLKAGLDLEMPSSDGKNDWLIAEAVRDGSLDEAVLDQAVYRILSVLEKYGRNRDTKTVFDMERDHQASKLAEDECAAWADAAVIFAGLPEAYESEGMDRTHMRLPRHQDQLIGEVLRIQPNTVVVLHNGSPVEMPWAGGVKGILEMYLGGEAVGESAADILMGKVNPSGRLSETFPLRLEDTPSYLNFPGETKTVCFSLDARRGAFYSEKIHDWYVEEGVYQIMVARSSADIRLQTEVMVRNPEKLPVEITLDTTFQELFEYPEVMEAVKPLRDLLAERFQKKVDSDQGNEKAMRTMLGGMPLRGALSFNHSDITVAQAEKMVQKANEIMRTKKNGE